MPELLTLICLAVTAATLVSASVQDVKLREVSDAHWTAIGTAGIAAMLMIALEDAVSAERLMVCAGSAMILFDILYDREWPPRYTIPFYAVMASMFIVPLAMSSGDAFVRGSMTVPACYILFLALFFGGVIKGGADAKCLIVLAILFPAYPSVFGLPMIGIPSTLMPVLIPFALAVLFHASLLSVFAMAPVIIRNIRRGDTKMPNMFTGHRMDASRVSDSHVWPMRDEVAADDGKIWVTPKIPFIVPITFAVFFVALFGNVLFLL